MTPYNRLQTARRLWTLALAIALLRWLLLALAPVRNAFTELVDWGSAWLTALEDEHEEVALAMEVLDVALLQSANIQDDLHDRRSVGGPGIQIRTNLGGYGPTGKSQLGPFARGSLAELQAHPALRTRRGKLT